MLNLFKIISLRHFRLKFSRTFLTTFGVVLGVALYVSIAIINESTRLSFRENIESVAGKAKLSVSAGETGFAESKLQIVQNTPGVKSAIPTIEARAFFKGAKEDTDSIYLLGVDLLKEQAVRDYKSTQQNIIDDPLLFFNQPDSIILTQALAQKRKLQINSKIQLATVSGMKTFVVRGLLNPEGAAKAYGGSLALMDIDAAQIAFGKTHKFDRIDIIPKDGTDIQSLQSSLLQQLGPGFSVEKPEVQADRTEKLLLTYQAMLTFFSFLALLVGLFVILNTVAVAVTERKREIGILRALGIERYKIALLFSTEALFIGFLGSILGCLSGWALATSLVGPVSNAVASQLMSRVHVSQLQFTLGQIISAISLGTFATLLAALWPAYQASRIEPLEAMKSQVSLHEASETNKQKRYFSFYAGIGMLLTSALSMVLKWGNILPIIQHLNTIFAVLGSALLGPTFVMALIQSTDSILFKKENAIFKLARRNLLKSRKRTSSNIMALMIGLFMVMLIATVRSSFHHTLMTWIDGLLSADLLVSSSGRIIVFEMQPLHENLEKEFLSIPGVRSPGQNRGIGQRLVRYQSADGKHRYVIKAIDRPADWLNFKTIPPAGNENQEALGRTLYDSKKPAVLVSENYFLKHPEKVGDDILFNTPTGQIQFRIVGKIQDFSSPEGVFYMDRTVYKKYWQDPLVNVFQINVSPGFNPNQVRASLESNFGKDRNIIAVATHEIRAQMQDGINRTFSFTHAVEMAALLVGLLGLLNTLLISVMERTREIGILRAVGMTKTQVFQMIFFESVLQGGLGSMISAALGGWIGMMWVKFSLSDVVGMVVSFHFPWESVATTIVLGILVSSIAGIYPALKASQMEITDALDYE